MAKKKAGSGFVKGAAILAFATFITKIIGLIYRIPLTKVLGDEGNGLYGDAFQVYTVLITLSAYGLPTAISKLVAERTAKGAYKDAHRVFKISMIYSGIFGGILSIIMWVFAANIANIMGSPRTVDAMRSLAPTVLIVVLMSSFRGYFQGLNAMAPTAISQVIEQLFNAAFSVILAYAFVGKGLEKAVLGSTLGTGIGALSGFIFILFVYWLVSPNIKKKIKKSKEYEYESNWHVFKKILITTLPILMGTAVFSLTSTIDLKMINNRLPAVIDQMLKNGQESYIGISNITGLSPVRIADMLKGQYSLKYLTLVSVPISLIISLSTAATPAISYSMAIKNYDDVREKTQLVMKIGMLFAFPAAIGMAILANPIIKLLFRSQPDGASLLQLGTIAIIFITISQICTGILQGMGKQHLPTIHALIACAVKIGLNLILLSVPAINIHAIIYSTIACYLIFSFLNLRSVIKLTGLIIDKIDVFIKPALISFAMGLVTLVGYLLLSKITTSSFIQIVVLVPIAIMVYGVAAIKFNALTPTELQMIPGGTKLIDLLQKKGIFND
ncbi:MAG TPA: polysaccharide biosynthesis protein [Epulopiscium sp.]|nr:polysaccharide biosynthesis protein [Candidatus Epulonipiscium sp.]